MLKFIKSNLSRDFVNIVLIFLSWRILITIIAFFAVTYVPLGATDRFLGGGPSHYNTNPLYYSWSNFDGEHYVSLAIFGYKQYEQAFFPLYPSLISIIPRMNFEDFFFSQFYIIFYGQIISNLFFLLSLVLLWELIKREYSKKVAYWTVILLTTFPTSFYFGAVYTESVFLFLSVVCFYYASSNKWWISSFFGILSSATRLFGVLLLPSLLIEVYQRKVSLKRFYPILLIPLGFISFMIYQYYSTGDAFAFYNLQKIVGEHRQSGIVLLPQVYYRYLKILFSINHFDPLYITIVVEFLVGILFALLPVIGYFKKVKLSYLFFALLGFLLPTFTGSFSSLPRYILVLFPSFLVMALLLENQKRFVKIIVLTLFFIGLVVETSLFVRAYWVG